MTGTGNCFGAVYPVGREGAYGRIHPQSTLDVRIPDASDWIGHLEIADGYPVQLDSRTDF